MGRNVGRNVGETLGFLCKNENDLFIPKKLHTSLKRTFPHLQTFFYIVLCEIHELDIDNYWNSTSQLLLELTGLIKKTGPMEKASKNIAFSAFKT